MADNGAAVASVECIDCLRGTFSTPTLAVIHQQHVELALISLGQIVERDANPEDCGAAWIFASKLAPEYIKAGQDRLVVVDNRQVVFSRPVPSRTESDSQTPAQ